MYPVGLIPFFIFRALIGWLRQVDRPMEFYQPVLFLWAQSCRAQTIAGLDYSLACTTRAKCGYMFRLLWEHLPVAVSNTFFDGIEEKYSISVLANAVTIALMDSAGSDDADMLRLAVDQVIDRSEAFTLDLGMIRVILKHCPTVSHALMKTPEQGLMPLLLTAFWKHFSKDPSLPLRMTYSSVDDQQLPF